MNNIITEDIINKAINESIDEFMLEEGFGDTLKGWGQKVKGWGQDFDNRYGNRFSKAWNGLKNGVKAYMDYRTNGQWNREYNSYVKGNGKFSGNFYLGKWLDYHYKRLQDIIYGDAYGNRTYYYAILHNDKLRFEHDWQNNQYILNDRYRKQVYYLKFNQYINEPSDVTIKNYYGQELSKSNKVNSIPKQKAYEIELNNKTLFPNPLKIYVAEDNTTPESYIAQNCTEKAFLNYTKNTLGDDYRNSILAYIRHIQEENNKNIELLKKDANENINHNDTLNWFTMQAFEKWLEKNGNNISQNKEANNSQNNTQQTQQQNQNAEQGYNPNWYNQAPPEDYNNNQNGQTSSGFDDVGHGAPNNNSQNITGKKDKNWRASNDVPIFKQTK